MSMPSLASATASPGSEASRRANAATLSAKVSAGHTSCTKPIRSARSAVTVSQARASQRAQCGPTIRVSRLMPPEPGMTARFTTSGRAKVAASEANRKSQDDASSTPRPRHGPWAASTTGFSHASISSKSRCSLR